MAERLTPFEIMERLISFPTVSRDTNLPLIDWVEAYLSSHKIESHRYTHESGEKAALMVHIGPQVEGGIVLSGHTDVVPVDGQPWTSDPWTVVERDGKYYGRGCCDMKGFDALAIWAAVEAHYRGAKRPLQLALSFDEEVGCTGAPPMIDRMLDIFPKASICLVGEPSMMQVVTGHKGGVGIKTHVQGFEVHSSLLHTGVSAIMYGARLINWANARNEDLMANVSDEGAIFDPPFSTVHVGMIEGGTANNITAKDCVFPMDFRILPNESVADHRAAYETAVREVEQDMQRVVTDTKITLTETFALPGLVPEQDGEAETLLRRLTGDNGTHVVSYGTEGGQFQERGYSTVICGPGNIEQAHQPDEYISVAQFNAGHDFMNKLLNTL